MRRTGCRSGARSSRHQVHNFTLMASLTPRELIPWPWAITPIDPETRICPSTSHILGVFAVVNVVASVVAIFAGHRRVVNFLTCGLLGNKGSQSWKYMWILQAGLMLGANALNAWLTVNAEGYDKSQMPAVWDLMLFYSSRPRLNWVFLTILLLMLDHRGEGWENATRQTLISEAVLQLIGLYYKGRTVHFAASHGYFLVGHLNGNPHQSDFLMMSVPALLYLIYGFVIFFIPFLIPKTEKQYKTISDDNSDLEPLTHHSSYRASSSAGGLDTFIYNSLFCWMLNWLFISGYTRLAGELYCPPKFMLQGGIWTIASAIGVFFGAG